MRIIDRHLLRTLFVPLLCCLLAFTMLFVLWDLFDHLAKFLEAKTPISQIATYYGLLILPTLEFLTPASLLLATLYAMWQLTRNNELTAMRASGVGFGRIMVPFLIVGFLFSLASILIKETVTPTALKWTAEFKERRYQKVENTDITDLAFYNSANRRMWMIDRMAANNPSQIIGVKLTEEREDGTRIRDLIADKAEWLDGTWWFYDLKIQVYTDQDIPDRQPVPVSPGEDTIKELPYLTETPHLFLSQATPWPYLTTIEMVRYLRNHRTLSSKVVAQKTYDIHSRLALPWACLIITLFGIPAGATTGRQNVLTGILIALGFFFGYYALMQVGLFLGKTSILEPWLGAWLSNIVFTAAAILMIARMR
jgi:lipopolysaccharide export system permease protein